MESESEVWTLDGEWSRRAMCGPWTGSGARSGVGERSVGPGRGVELGVESESEVWALDGSGARSGVGERGVGPGRGVELGVESESEVWALDGEWN